MILAQRLPAALHKTSFFYRQRHVETHKIIRGENVNANEDNFRTKKVLVTCGQYSGRTFDDTKFAIADTSPSRTGALELDAPLELILRGASLFNCMQHMKQMQRMIDPKDANHITFSFTLVRFMWSCIREMFSCDWNPTSFGDFYSLMQGVPGQSRGVLALDLHHYSMLGSLEHQE